MTTNTGVLKSWNTNRGYGFIYEPTLLADGKSGVKCWFVHITRVASGEPILESAANFNIGPGNKGHEDQAVDVEFTAPSEKGDAR
jgi:cold shock CspA family protein